jgi:glycosyltransferase involved in cell wall biosynthesis
MTARVLVTAQSGALAGVERRVLQEVGVLRGMGMAVLAAPSRFPRGEQFRCALATAGAELIDWQPYKFIERQQPGFPFPQICSMAVRKVATANLDLAHVAMPWTTVGLSRVWALAQAGVPIVLGLHCTYDRARWPTALTPYIASALRGVVGGYAVSQSVRESFLVNFSDWVRPDQIQVIPNGVDVHRFRPDASLARQWRETHAVPEDAQLVVFCGRLEPFKDPMFALDVFEEAARSDVRLYLAIAGDGPLAAALRERVAASDVLAGRVRFLGFIDNVDALLRAGDVYLSTSTPHEGFPLAPSEALASGLSILIPDHPVFREAFGSCTVAHLAVGRDPAKWAQALLGMLSTGARDQAARSSGAAREFAESRLTAEQMTDRLQTFYGAWL